MLTALLAILLIYVGYQIYKDPKNNGLVTFLFYLQISGVVKRLLLYYEPGVINLIGYNVIVGIQYVFFTAILLASIPKQPFLKFTQRQIVINLLVALCFLVSIILSRFDFNLVVILLILNFFPMLSFYIGLSLGEKEFNKIIKFLYNTSFLHIAYCLIQFVHGPFDFESSFFDEKSSLVDVSTGSFFRSVPLYDNIEPLYLHLAIVLPFAKKRTTPLNLSPNFAILYQCLILIVAILIGNRNGLMLFLLIQLMVYFKQIFRRPAVIISVTLATLISLNLFYVALFRLIDDTTVELVSNSDLSTRLGTLGTFSDRLVGRKNATENLNLFGHGLGSSGLITAVFENKYENVTNAGADFRNHFVWAHDIVGEMMIDFGILGAVILTSVLLINILHVQKYSHLISSVVLSTFLVAAITGSSIFIGRSAYLLFLVFGFGIKKYHELKYNTV